MLLELLGHQVQPAANGVAALEAARASPPDVMLVDIGLPGIDGYEVVRRVRHEPAHRGCRSRCAHWIWPDGDRQNSMAAGFDYHLVKPIRPDALTAHIDGEMAPSQASLVLYTESTGSSVESAAEFRTSPWPAPSGLAFPI